MFLRMLKMEELGQKLREEKPGQGESRCVWPGPQFLYRENISLWLSFS